MHLLKRIWQISLASFIKYSLQTNKSMSHAQNEMKPKINWVCIILFWYLKTILVYQEKMKIKQKYTQPTSWRLENTIDTKSNSTLKLEPKNLGHGYAWKKKLKKICIDERENHWMLCKWKFGLTKKKHQKFDPFSVLPSSYFVLSKYVNMCAKSDIFWGENKMSKSYRGLFVARIWSIDPNPCSNQCTFAFVLTSPTSLDVRNFPHMYIPLRTVSHFYCLWIFPFRHTTMKKKLNV